MRNAYGMTLGRLLFAVISAVFFLVLVGIETIYLRGAQHNLQAQLESHAQDAATSLGLSLGILLGRGDNALAETVINAAFDRGHYQRIEFVSLSNERLVEKVLPPSEAAAPRWIVELFPLNAPTAESLVSSGWRQLGKIRVTSHPRFAYEQLWDSTRDSLLWLLVLYVAALAAMRIILRGILQPLAAVEKAAESIARRDFVTLDARPSTRELSRVVEAMNQLSTKVRAAFEVETARAEKLARDVFTDPVTGMLNRGGFADRFKVRYEGVRDSFSGTLALAQVSGVAEINRAFGEAKGDELLRAIGQIMEETTNEASGFCGRWAGALFALVFPAVAGPAAREMLIRMRARIDSAINELGMIGQAQVAVGAVSADAGRFLLDGLVQAADAVLAQAAEKGPGSVEVREAQPEVLATPDDWRDLIEDALANRRIRLVEQSVLAIPSGGILHLELMGRLLDGRGNSLPAAEFMPMVGRLGLAAKFDSAVAEYVVAEWRGAAQSVRLAVNVAPQSIADQAFVKAVVKALGDLRSARAHLVFELTEHGALQDVAAAVRFAKVLRENGAALAIDHFGLHRDSLALTQRLLPAYVKLSGVFTSKLADQGTRFYVETLAKATHQLDVPMIAQSVEDAAVLPLLEALGFGGYQGFAIGRPAPWPDSQQGGKSGS